MRPRDDVITERGLCDVRDLVGPRVTAAFAVANGTAWGALVAEDAAAGGTY